MKHYSNFFFLYGIETSIFVSALTVYTLCASRGIVQGDTGEFLATAAEHGIPHDPSYPLYSIITQSVFSLTHSVWALHALSGVFSAVALVFAYKIIMLLTKSHISAIFSVLSLASYEFFFFNALIVQVHALHVLILSSLYYFLLRYFLEQQSKDLYAVGLIIGLGVAHNHTIIFTLPAVLFVLVYHFKNLSLPKGAIFCSFGLIGLSLYAYTVFNALTHPHSMLNWGRITDLNSFLAVFFRTNYGSLSLTANQAGGPFVYSSFVYFFKSLWQTSWYVVGFAIASLYVLHRKNWPYAIILGSWILTGPVFYLLMHHYMYTIVHQTLVEQFLPYSFFFLALLAGLGFHLINDMYLKKISPYSVYGGVALLFVVFGSFTLLKVNQAESQLTDKLTQSQLAQVSQGGVLITVADGLYFPAIYWQDTMQYRTDIIIINLSLLSPWYIQNLLDVYPELRSVITKNTLDFTKLCDTYGKTQKLFLAPWYQEFSAMFKDKCSIYPYGLISKVVPKGTVPDVKTIKKYNDEQFSSLTSAINLASYTNKTARQRESLYYLSEQLNYTGLYYQRQKQLDWAQKTFTTAADISPDQTNALVNAASYYFQKQQAAKTIEILEKGIQRNPADMNLYYTLGVVQFKLNQKENAYNTFKKYLTFSPPETPTTLQIKQFLTQYEKTSNMFGTNNP